MTSTDTWSPWIAIILTGAPLLLAFVGAVFSLYLSHRHMDAIKEALKNSRYIYIWGTCLGKRGVIWSLLEIAKIAGMVMWPWASLRIGELDPTDLKNFPPRLKRLLVINATMMFIAFTWIVVEGVFLDFR
ncbi:hypothetical protein [Pseudomonas helleri]|uniref:hypothetical protein n=1 Tax=Pseudomonas helleri TaxID=1608996 RepID=UPI0028E824DC|nr:hypothetical protein [Pseudomonas helleri]